MSTFYRQSFFLPMVLSLLLLSLFIVYFLDTEYTKEKENIVLEERDAAFVNLFTNIRSAKGPVEWVKDSMGNELIVQLDMTADTMYSRFHTLRKMDTLITLNPHKTFESAEVIALEYADDTFSTTLKTIESLHESDKPRLRNHVNVTIDSNQDTTIVIDMLETKGDLRNSIFEFTGKEISPWSIWKRMVPQVLFSLLLFGSVGMAYFMIGKSLSKERQLSQLRNEFMSNMSHELKTPVSTISVALEALSNFNAADNKDLREEYIDISKSEVERLGLLVDKALNISLFEQGKSIYDKQHLDLKHVIEDIIKTLKVQLDNQNVSLEFGTSGHSFAVKADRTHLTNVVHNLIENAVKYAIETPEIRINLAEKADAIEIVVTDNGPGIAPEFQDKVFDKFFRVPQGDRHNVKGHGLGLSYVKQVVERHNGSIKVKSGVEVGTSFVITLPKAEKISEGIQ
ncbi:MAG: HAMP domain-containing histidine kinase [Saprospiraceae bacterium]|nr:HAMP domain-containing histidine kinase [Saprospiraceae bacterium]